LQDHVSLHRILESVDEPGMASMSAGIPGYDGNRTLTKEMLSGLQKDLDDLCACECQTYFPRETIYSPREMKAQVGNQTSERQYCRGRNKAEECRDTLNSRLESPAFKLIDPQVMAHMFLMAFTRKGPYVAGPHEGFVGGEHPFDASEHFDEIYIGHAITESRLYSSNYYLIYIPGYDIYVQLQHKFRYADSEVSRTNWSPEFGYADADSEVSRTNWSHDKRIEMCDKYECAASLGSRCEWNHATWIRETCCIDYSYRKCSFDHAWGDRLHGRVQDPFCPGLWQSNTLLTTEIANARSSDGVKRLCAKVAQEDRRLDATLHVLALWFCDKTTGLGGGLPDIPIQMVMSLLSTPASPEKLLHDHLYRRGGFKD
jgi:hypothetical protein